MLLTMLVAQSAHAMTVRRGEDVVISADEVVDDDLYVIGRTVRVDGTVHGDLNVIGRRVEISGEVDGTVQAIGQRVILAGPVDGDARVLAEGLLLASAAQIGGDLVAADGWARLAPGSSIGRDAALAGGQLLVAGSIDRDLTARAGSLRIDAPVSGSVDATIGELARPPSRWARRTPRLVPPGLTLGSRANIGGRLAYQAPDPVRIDPGAQVASTVWEQTLPPPGTTAGARIWGFARRFAGLWLVGGLALLLAPNLYEEARQRATHRPLASLGRGLLVALGAFVSAAAIAVVSLAVAAGLGVIGLGGLSTLVLGAGAMADLGWALGLALALGWLAQGVIGLAIGRSLIRPARLGAGWALGLGLLIVLLLEYIPWVGGWIGALIALVGLGAAVPWREKPEAV